MVFCWGSNWALCFRQRPQCSSHKESQCIHLNWQQTGVLKVLVLSSIDIICEPDPRIPWAGAASWRLWASIPLSAWPVVVLDNDYQLRALRSRQAFPCTLPDQGQYTVLPKFCDVYTTSFISTKISYHVSTARRGFWIDLSKVNNEILLSKGALAGF